MAHGLDQKYGVTDAIYGKKVENTQTNPEKK
jgi:hypothetical protein